jgi:hypothetical protein
MAVLHGCKGDAARVLEKAVKGGKVSHQQITAAIQVLDRTEGKAIQRIQAEQHTGFVFALPPVITDGHRWEAEAQRVLGAPVIEAKAEPVAGPPKLNLDANERREVASSARTAPPVNFEGPDPAPDAHRLPVIKHRGN